MLLIGRRSANHSRFLFKVSYSPVRLHLFCTKCINMFNQSDVNLVQHQRILRRVFLSSLQSVQPKSLFASEKRIFQIFNDNTIQIYQHRFDIAGKRCHLVGFGKAVLGMAVQIEQQLGERLVSGILSVPLGTGLKFADDADMKLRSDSVIEVHEGAENNLPDEAAQATAIKILDFVATLDKNDVLLVVISGGGSALIPAPVSPITLEEKCTIIKALAAKEATINDINTVRIAMSLTKGGKLAVAAKSAGSIISLVISDVSGDPLDIIASGPTVPYKYSDTAVGVLKRFQLYDTLPTSIRSVIKMQAEVSRGEEALSNAFTYLIGNNTLAANTAIRELQRERFQAICLSTKIEGNVEVLSQCYVKLAQAIIGYSNGEELAMVLQEMDAYFHFHEDAAGQLMQALEVDKSGPICLVAGGEPTVRIAGGGLGGRSQELAMRISGLLAANDTLEEVVFLSAGTDGIDGPTDAAGAIGCSQVWRESERELTGTSRSFKEYLADNDSYNFYRNLCNGMYHVITGHTGTNVMDLHLMIIPRLARS